MKLRVRFLILSLILGIAVKLNAQYNFNVIHTFSETDHEIVFASYNSDGTYIVTAGSDSSIILWNADRRTIYRTLTGLKGRPNTAVFSPDNKFVFSGGRDNLVSKWDLGTMPSEVVKTFEGYSGPVKSVDISPDGKYLATGSAGGVIKIWDLRNSSLVFDLKGQNKTKDINSVIFSPDGKILASGDADGIITLWNTETGIKTVSKTGQKNGIHHITISPDGKLLASCGYNNDIIIWQLPGLINPVVLKNHKDWVYALDFSPDSKSLISGGRDGYIILWDVTSGKILHKSEKQQNLVLSLDFNPARADFISSYHKTADLETWALSGLDETQWKRPVVNATTNFKAGNIINDNQQKVVQEIPKESQSQSGNLTRNNSMIEVFSPVPVQGKYVHDKNSILIVGRVSDPQGINTLLINKNLITLTEGGVFQFNLNLVKGENLVDFIAISNKGIMNEKQIKIDCIAENAPAPGEKVPEIARYKYHALLIGVSEYQSSDLNELANPVKDVEKLYNVLTTRYTFDKENVKLLKNPTLQEIYLAFEDLIKTLTEKDNLLIFYAGHGDWDEKGKIGYWLPSDASKNTTFSWFRNSTLRDFISSMQTKHVVLIADACFSGSIFNTRAAFTDTSKGIEKLAELQSRKAMTSGVLQEVPDESKFLEYLVRELDKNEEDYLPSERLFNNIKPVVLSNSQTVPQYGVIQNVGDEGGDFIFIKR